MVRSILIEGEKAQNGNVEDEGVPGGKSKGFGNDSIPRLRSPNPVPAAGRPLSLLALGSLF
jgi:hypothetical protein